MTYSGADRALVASDLDALLTRIHDRYMNKAGFARNADGRWIGAGQGGDPNHDYGIDANVVFSVRCAVAKYFQAIANQAQPLPPSSGEVG